MKWCCVALFWCLVLYFGTIDAANENVKRSWSEISEILDKVKKIEEQINNENRIRQITEPLRIDSTMDRMNRKLDQIIALLGQDSGTGVSSSAVIPRDFSTDLNAIDNRLRSLESSVDKWEEGLVKVDATYEKVGEIEKRTTNLKDDLTQKLRKMMNVITAVYEMNKDMKTNLGGRSESSDTRSEGDTTSASDFLIANLEELERKIKEQFSVLSTEIRSEITSLKIVASSVNDRCETSAGGQTETPSDDDDWPDLSEFSRGAKPQREGKKVSSGRSSNTMEDTLDNLVETLGRSTREIREEIHQGMQDIDQKLSNLTQMALDHECDSLSGSESVLTPRRVPSQDSSPNVIVTDQEVEEVTQSGENCSSVASDVTMPKSCAELRRGGATCDGVYVIFPKGIRAVRVFCDMTTEGGGWTVLLRRGDFGDKMTSFHKNWDSYKHGFGDMEGEFWLGNDNMNMLSTQETNLLRVNLEAFDGDTLNLSYSSFLVAGESDRYRLQLGTVVGTPSPAANSLRYHSNHPFSTYDRKNDAFEQNCASTYKGGWWFNGCYFGFLTGEYFRPDDRRENWQGILWYDWKGNASLKGAEMKIRPKNFST
uniref:U54-Liphistoxin-Lsp1a_1 n=1 Tax=Liphistius sp. SGP-2016 TaxID=1905180 RepID=A0A4Q8K7U2_9ARAC